jgi:ABC-type sugar transport system ATPase subunit
MEGLRYRGERKNRLIQCVVELYVFTGGDIVICKSDIAYKEAWKRDIGFVVKRIIKRDKFLLKHGNSP